MKNKITKFLTILSIIFISLFIKSKNTYAFECVWNLKPTYIDFNYKNGTTKVNRILNSLDVNGNHEALYILVYDSNRAGSNFVLKEKYISSNKISIIDKFSSADFDNAALVNWASNGSCPNYVKIYKGSGLSGMEAKISNSDEFVKYLKNQYDVYSSPYGDDLYGNIEHKSMVFTNVGSTYPTKHLNEMINDRGTPIEKIKALQVDTGKSGMDKLYYESTKTAWYMYANSRIDQIDYANYDNKCKDEKNIDAHVTTLSVCLYDDISTFKIWFDTVSRWIFEEDYSSFKKYYRYANTGTLTQTQIDNNLNLFNADTGLTENKSEKDTLLKDKCLALCPRNATSLTNCQSGSTYQKCKSATDACKNMSSDSAYQTCLKGRMGEADYNSFINSYNSRMEELEKEESEYRQTIKDALSRVSAPDLDIEFNPYEVTCDDVAIFHTFYVILEIMAPILVILFGTIDYAKAVIASDVEKMQKAKKNFPKRLGLLLLFVFIPLIVSFLIGEFSSTNSSLMYCIINGG